MYVTKSFQLQFKSILNNVTKYLELSHRVSGLILVRCPFGIDLKGQNWLALTWDEIRFIRHSI